MGLCDPGIKGLTEEPAHWLESRGPQADIVLSSRVRLARNVDGHDFPSAAGPGARDELREAAKAAAQATQYLVGAAYFALEDLNDIDRRALVERRMASPDLARQAAGSAVLVGPRQVLSLMINEEDHLRLQCLLSGMDLLEVFRIADQVDDQLQEHLRFCFSGELGFLTACPSNTGTGLRASILVHLPALVLTKQIEGLIKAITQAGMSIRGLYGENSEVLGHLFQISNRITLGRTELEIIEGVERIGGQLLAYEQEARRTLMAKARHETEDKVWRAQGILAGARVLTSEEFLNLSSAVRLGLWLKIIDRPSVRTLNQLLVLTQPAHLQIHLDREMDAAERDIRRALLVRERMMSES